MRRVSRTAGDSRRSNTESKTVVMPSLYSDHTHRLSACSLQCRRHGATIRPVRITRSRRRPLACGWAVAFHGKSGILGEKERMKWPTGEFHAFTRDAEVTIYWCSLNVIVVLGLRQYLRGMLSQGASPPCAVIVVPGAAPDANTKNAQAFIYRRTSTIVVANGWLPLSKATMTGKVLREIAAIRFAIVGV